MIKKEYILKKNPWKRFLARNFDLFLFWLIFWLLIWFFVDPLTMDYLNWYNIWFLIILLWMFYEFFLLLLFWNTIWKVLFWLKIINTNNPTKWLTVKQCFKRTYLVNLLFWLPIISIFFLITQFFRLKNEWITFYDLKFNTQVYEFSKKVIIKDKKLNLSLNKNNKKTIERKKIFLEKLFFNKLAKPIFTDKHLNKSIFWRFFIITYIIFFYWFLTFSLFVNIVEFNRHEIMNIIIPLWILLFMKYWITSIFMLLKNIFLYIKNW